eukprot:TRINITY_DN1911_c0_g1_i1.p1 TRINITY_DN1911_c0_g1~~TRINITY_DN1911_c0_g1_i1.p1  ORF type:complete len:548 (+),score=168.81 TRINITY_DN1911_c0_g1_i1:172-1815(+)
MVPMRQIIGLLLIGVVAASIPAECDVSAFGSIMQLKEMADSDLESAPVYHDSSSPDDSKNLGDSDEEPIERLQEKQRINAEHAMAQLATTLSKHVSVSLGESAVHPFEEDVPVDADKLSTLLRPSHSMRGTTKAVSRMLDYLGMRMMQGKPLNQKEMALVRHYYLAQTARVLGEYSFDASQRDLRTPGLDKAEAKASHRMADQLKRHMDQTDAEMHMRKMGVSHDVPLSADEEAKLGGETSGTAGLDPLTMAGPPPRFDSIMKHLQEAGRLADFVDQVEATVQEHRAAQPTPSLQHLELREARITSGVEELLGMIRQGKLFKDQQKLQGNSPKAELEYALTDAASKEDDAKIVADAGSIAEHSIKRTLKKGMAIKQPPKEAPADLHVPVELLRHHTTSALNQGLTKALALYSKRHSQKRRLSAGEHKKVSAMLRTIAAHMMNKVQHASKPAPDAPVAVPVTDPAPVTAAPVAPVAAPAVAVQKPAAAPVEVAAKPLVEAGAVKQFIWHTLGNKKASVTAAPDLKTMLQQGVQLFGGNKIFFTFGKPQ